MPGPAFLRQGRAPIGCCRARTAAEASKTRTWLSASSHLSWMELVFEFRTRQIESLLVREAMCRGSLPQISGPLGEIGNPMSHRLDEEHDPIHLALSHRCAHNVIPRFSIGEGRTQYQGVCT